ncbi:D-alanine--D-alanine ligase [Halothiobacillus diazotrophicus]|uniref:D-alanine--D-alanine ligase n=1 Tax=Halothiobacillus diazotrophicus TaxID=1860122 RepID=A0A191ZJ81_9GAMM|nr:D-alanine--D-alanine ligase [Halothiobacillus diazotrophicus]ANJ67944.1 D-alanine--D-alanine ligase [Halothiobacillus diazotrophicus]
MRDPKAFGRVVLLMGGWSSERAVSLKSGATVEAALKRAGVDVTVIDVGPDFLVPLAAAHAERPFDRAFIILHGRGGEDGRIQAVLELLGIPYTGTDVTGSAIGMDKLACKRIWRGEGLPTPPWALVDTIDEARTALDDLGLPVMVKPVAEGSSVGVAKVDRAEDLPAAFEEARRFGRVMMERFVRGGEYTVAILDGRPLPAILLATPHAFYDYNAKYLADDTEYRIPCGLDAADETHMQQIALRAFALIGGSGWGRVDFMRDAEGNCWLIEVNTVPGMTDHSLVPMAARAVGIDIETLCLEILATAGHTDAKPARGAGDALGQS